MSGHLYNNMKHETKIALIQLAQAVQDLAAAVVLTTGIDTASKVMTKAQLAITALNKEETTP